ncbi:hypothetical protein [Paenibacillus mesophilus]|jgi:hypothetical protein|uniref:hypothetical protein n=1 Tax=Paenibacillus mesophilus TaxID=2582849 RepID=UPI00130539B4|nr:hypothetical protein [Paenibacillus mesophilus]
MSLGQGMNVLWFGAKGDGVSDDSDVVNGVLLQFANVYLPPERTTALRSRWSTPT